LVTGVSAGVARSWLLSNFDQLRIDMFEPDPFPNVLQEIIIISGIRTEPVADTEAKRVTFVEHFSSEVHRTWVHELSGGSQSWTRCLLTPEQLGYLEQLRLLPPFKPLDEVAGLEVSI